MFYSQFILAKKGPLGTIWIAAHLERKLRKNQVADTDIGDSVDSILFPDVPIALRLSSHLLLGVVRIYSRKVNYLFDDCSEALLKVKQAFRSAAVDLPPEQSKAPYHSITLPETFDLDDFELPDNDIFQGNYVDHHVSSREQITLQDTMDGVAYSSLRFGLDERFGDADTSGLDLDEELFLDKGGTSGDVGVSTDPQAPEQPFKQGDQHERMTENAELMIDRDEVIHFMDDDAQAPRTPGLVEEPNISNAQETSACDDHFESEDHHLTESTVKGKLENVTGEENIHCEDKLVDGWTCTDDENAHPVPHKVPENGYHQDLDSEQLNPQESSSANVGTVQHMSPDDHAPVSGSCSLLDKHVTHESPVSELADKIGEAADFTNSKEHINEGGIDDDKVNDCFGQESVQNYETPDGSTSRNNLRDQSTVASNCHHQMKAVSDDSHISAVMEDSGNLETAVVMDNRSPDDALGLDKDSKGRRCNRKAEEQTRHEEKKSEILSGDVNGKLSDAQVHILKPCNADMDPADLSTPEGGQSVDPNVTSEKAAPGSVEVLGGEEPQHAAETSPMLQGVISGSESIPTADNMRNGASDEGVHSDIDKSHHEMDKGTTEGSPKENVIRSTGPDLPAPENLLSVVGGSDDLPRSLLMEFTPKESVKNDDGDAGSNVVSGKKRSFTESTLTEQSLNSVESSRIVRSKRTVESIPDDDDLLSSILVGRRSSVLKVRSTPPPSEITSAKRIHSTPRTSAAKRKVLMDETMVLHGDTIRQQLINTEDIRRVRKKAPCTRPEITMIQKQFLEDEIFLEPVYSGVSTELTSLHNQTRDLSGIRISLDDVTCTSLETEADVRLDIQKDDDDWKLGAENAMGSSPRDVAKENETEGTDEPPIIIENYEGEIVAAPSVDNNKLDEDFSVSLDANTTESPLKATTDIEPSNLLLVPPEDATSTEADVRNSSIGGNIADPGIDDSSLPTDEVLGDRGDTLTVVDHVGGADNKPTDVDPSVDDSKTCEQDNSLHLDAVDRPDDPKTDEVPFLLEANGGEVDESHNIRGEACDHTAEVNAIPPTGDEVLLQAADGGETFETFADNNNREAEYDFHRFIGKGIDQSLMDSFTGEADARMDDIFMDDGERPNWDLDNPLNSIGVETSAVIDHDEFNYSTAGNDTEFLNVDDDDDGEPTDDYIPNEGARLDENAGWSSRTRAVANYLQTTFYKQTGNAVPKLSLDNLLVGKSRKEASRMFFETLVLKTKDYIHVEQGNPFESITIKPRSKLIKSDF